MRLDGLGRTLVTATNEKVVLSIVSVHSRDIHNVIYMITHGNEQIEKPVFVISFQFPHVY